MPLEGNGQTPGGALPNLPFSEGHSQLSIAIPSPSLPAPGQGPTFSPTCPCASGIKSEHGHPSPNRGVTQQRVGGCQAARKKARVLFTHGLV